MLSQILSSKFSLIQIINLPSRSDRIKELETQFVKLNESIYKTAVIFNAIRPTTQENFPSIGARGCFESHFNILKSAVITRPDFLLIIEDDCNFVNPELVALSVDELFSAPETLSWDVFYGGHLILDSNESHNQNNLKYNSIINPTTEVQNTHCIGFSLNAIDKIVPYFEAMLARKPGDPNGGPMHVDGAYTWFRKDNPQLKTVISYPAIAVQRPSRSDIASLKWYDRTPLISTVTQLARKVRSSR
jgi:hypothetical protein